MNGWMDELPSIIVEETRKWIRRSEFEILKIVLDVGKNCRVYSIREVVVCGRYINQRSLCIVDSQGFPSDAEIDYCDLVHFANRNKLDIYMYV